jgi:F-type H+-transporting ATPase subunit gamma
VQAASQAAVKAFENKEFDVIELVYSEFKNAATQRFVVERFLPIPKVEKKEGLKKADLYLNQQRSNLLLN